MSRRTVFSILFVVVLLGAGLFIGLIFSYYQKIMDGTISAKDLPRYAFTDRMTSSAVARQSASGVGSVDVVTSDDPSIGPADAILTIVEFADFSCPFSKEESYVVRRAAETYSGLIRVIFRDFPLTDIHPDARLAAEAGSCAQSLGQFWPYHDKLFANQVDFSREALIDYALEVGLSAQKFESCLNSTQVKEEVAQDIADGQAAGVYGTPTFFFNGQRIEGAVPEAIFGKIISYFVPGV
ncbi:MAG: DsbA family protein [Patescibacteria group bacterium]